MSWDLSGPIADRAMFHADNCYSLPNARITSYRCKTHTQSNTAFRGFGGPQGMIGMERVIDQIAATLDRDPAEVRATNFYPHKDIAGDEGKIAPYGMVVEDCIISDIWSELSGTSDYAARRGEIREWNAGSPVLKRGIAMTPVKFGISFTNTTLNQAGALVHVYNDGSIHLNHGGTEMGQGLFVKVAQVVASEFQVDLDRVKITATTTGKVPNTSATAASSGSDLNGMAAREAVGKIKRRLADFLAEQYQARPADVRFEAGRVHIGNESLPFDEAIGKAYAARVSLSATGFYATPKIRWDKATAQGRPFFYCAYGAAVTEVAIDTLTGENRLLRVDILHDVGRSPEPGHRPRPDRGRFRAGRGLADHRGTGVGRPGPADDPCAVDLQDPGLFRPGAGHEHPPVRPRRECRGHDLPLQGGRRAAADARDFGADGPVGCRGERRRLRDLSVPRCAGDAGAGAVRRGAGACECPCRRIGAAA